MHPTQGVRNCVFQEIPGQVGFSRQLILFNLCSSN